MTIIYGLYFTSVSHWTVEKKWMTYNSRCPNILTKSYSCKFSFSDI
jgi:hypothetical protein